MADEFKGTPEEVQAKLLAAWEEFKTNYHADKEGEQEFDKYAGAPMDAEIQEAEGIELTADEMETLRREKKITLPDGRVLHYAGKPTEEMAQLKEAVKTLIKKTLEA
jgi:hypothetical protein